MSTLKPRSRIIRDIMNEIVQEADKAYKPAFNHIRKSDNDMSYCSSDWIAIITSYVTKAYVGSGKNDDIKRRFFIKGGAVLLNAVQNLYHSNRKHFYNISVKALDLYFGSCYMYALTSSEDVGCISFSNHNVLYDNSADYNRILDIFHALESNNSIYTRDCRLEIELGKTSLTATVKSKSKGWNNSPYNNPPFTLFKASCDISKDLITIKAIINNLMCCFCAISELEINNRPNCFNHAMMTSDGGFLSMTENDSFATIDGNFTKNTEVNLKSDRIEILDKSTASGRIMGMIFSCEDYIDRERLINSGFAYTAHCQSDSKFDLGFNGRNGVITEALESVMNSKDHSKHYVIGLSRGEMAKPYYDQVFGKES